VGVECGKHGPDERREYGAPDGLHVHVITQVQSYRSWFLCQKPSTYLDFAKSTVTVNNLGGNRPDTDPSAAHKSRYSNIGASTDG
jgi:hypothetical protein